MMILKVRSLDSEIWKYIPEKQDIIWLDFDPSVGREIQKRRPALVVF